MGIEYTGILEMLGTGLGFGLLFGAAGLAVLWGALYALERIFPEAPRHNDHMLRLLETNVEAIPTPKRREHKEAA
jgi:hypothetical protein